MFIVKDWQGFVLFGSRTWDCYGAACEYAEQNGVTDFFVVHLICTKEWWR